MKIAILGGTGNEGRGLALRWGHAGQEVILGSRSAEKGESVAAELRDRLRGGTVTGAGNEQAAREGDVVVSTLPHQGHKEILQGVAPHLHGKLLMVATVVWPPGPMDRPSAAEEARQVLGDGVRVVAAFQTVSAKGLQDFEHSVEEDTLVCGPRDARREAIAIIRATGIRGIEAGPLEQARVAEALTGLLLKVNKAYGIKAAGLRITGIDV